MRITPNGQRVYPESQGTSHSRRTSFSDHVEVLSFDNSLPVHESIEGARVRHQLMKQPVSPPKPTIINRPVPSHGGFRTNRVRKVLGHLIALSGIALCLSFAVTGPIGIGIGIGLFYAGMLLAASATKYIPGRACHSQQTESRLISAILDADESRREICDVSHLNITDLPADIGSTQYLRYIIVNKQSARFLPRQIDGIQIIGK